MNACLYRVRKPKSWCNGSLMISKTAQHTVSVLDIGTGSGCIPVSLKLSLGAASVISCDISQAAIMVGAKNASNLQADVVFLEADFLDTVQQEALGQYSIIVSNPPYIPKQEKATMHLNVAHFEPDTALFVPDHDPLLFYRAIATFSKEHLQPDGWVYCELHQDYAQATRDCFLNSGFKEAELRKDMSGNWRMLKAGR